METTMKATVYAKKLRGHLAILKKRRPAQIRKYNLEFQEWKKNLSRWVAKEGVERVKEMSIKNVKEHNRFHYSWDGNFFKGAPEPPKYPSDKQIREIQSTLRHLAITGQEKIRVSTSDVERLMGENNDD